MKRLFSALEHTSERILIRNLWNLDLYSVGYVTNEIRERKPMSLFVKKAVREYAKKKNLKVGSDFYQALDDSIKSLINEAGKRAVDNKRKTLKAYDL